MKQRVCKFCGKPFIPNSNRQYYCKRPHYRTCPVCGKEYLEDNVDNLKKPPVACSYECRVKKTQQTSMEKYGMKAPGNNSEARKKASATMMKHLGVPYAMMSKEVQSKSKSTLIERYGVDNVGKNPDIIRKRMETCRLKYNGILPFNSKESYDKMHQTMIERYGVPYYPLTKEFEDKYGRNRISNVNLRFSELLKSKGIYHELEYHLGSKIYDIFIPSSNIVVEIDPSYTHSIVGNHWNHAGLPKYYHFDKSRNAIDNGCRCIHIFDWDNWNKIVDLIQKPLVQVYARQCILYKLRPEVAKQFIHQYDIYDNFRGQILFLGLVYQGNLVQVMSFRKASKLSKHYIQICSMCTKFRYQVVGGFSKLLNFATRYLELYNIVVYNDNSKFSGNVFDKIGMKLDYSTSPQLVWSKKDKYLFDSQLSLYHKSQDDLIADAYLPVYNCGYNVYTIDV